MESILTDLKGRMIIKSIAEKTVKAYLKEVGVISFEALTLQQKEQMFLLAIEDFYIGNLDLDEFSTLSGSLWNSLGANRNSEFSESLHAADELSYYFRSISNEQDRATSMLEQFILEIRAFFEKHKPERAKEVFPQ